MCVPYLALKEGMFDLFDTSVVKGVFAHVGSAHKGINISFGSIDVEFLCFADTANVKLAWTVCCLRKT